MKTLVLDGTAISIQVAMSTSAATTNPTFVATYADNAGSGITEGATDGALNGSTDVSVVPAPTGSNRRVVKDITIYNGDTAAVTLFVKYDNNATQRTLAKVTLAVGDTWTTDGTFDTNGQLKTVAGVVSLTSQVSGTLPVANGGSGATSLTGVLKGNGTSAFTAATAGTDFVEPGGALGTPSSGTLTNATGLPISTGVSGLGTNVATALAVNIGSSGAAVVNGGVLGTPSSGTLTNCTVDGTNPIGYRDLPAVGTKTGSYSLAVGDVGKYVQVGSGGSITIPDATFAEGDIIAIANNTSSGVTITCSITTAYIAGTDTDKASVTLATRGLATVVFLSGTVCIISGNVS
jgi:hypothetical protein